MTDRGSSKPQETKGGVLGYLETKVGDEVENFYDPRYEGRRLFSEVLGTFFMVLVAAGGAVVNAQSGGQIPLAVRVTALGLLVMAVMLFMGGVYVAHFSHVLFGWF